MKTIFESKKGAWIKGLLLLTAAVAMSNATAAPITAYDFTFDSGQLVDASDYSFGFEFVVGASDLYLQNLGYYAYGAGTTNDNTSFITSAHDVGLWDTAAPGTLLTSASITSSDVQSGNFFYKSVTPLTLLAGHTYRIAGATGSALENNAHLPSPINSPISSYVGFTQGSGFTISGGAYVSGNALAYPNSVLVGGGTDFYGTVNFKYDTVPEPATAALLLAGGLLFLGVRRKKS